jgi:hypothetical protein
MWKHWFAIFLLLSTVSAFDFQYDAFAQIKMFAVPNQNVFFINVHVDANPVPNKPFTVYADVQSQSVNWSDLIVYMTAPAGMSVVSPTVATLAFTSQGNTERASWTMLASDTGSYPMTITAHSNFPLDTETFDITVNVGSPHSLVLSGMSVPGNLFANDNFTASIKLKNSGTVADTNVLTQIFVPAGLQLLDDVTQSVSSLGPGQEVTLKWRLRAESAGSHVLLFNYSSTNAGHNSASTGVNVGTKPVATGALLSIVTHSTTLRPNSINPIVVDIANNGVQDIHNLQIVSASGGGYLSSNTPLWIGDLAKNDKKTLTLQINTFNETLSLQIPIIVQYDSGGNSYAETYQTGLQLENHPDFKINTVTVNPPLSYAGDTADKIDVQIFNAGMEANDVYATLNLPNGISPAWGGATSVYFGKIDTFQTVTAQFFVNVNDAISSGNYPLSLSVKTGDMQTPLNVNFIVAPKAQFQLISKDDSQLYPGATNVPFKIAIKNTGTIAAQTITTKLLSGNSVPGVKSDSITSVGNMENIGTILPGQTFVTTFMVNLDPEFAAGDQSTSVEIDWAQNSTSTSNAFVQTVIIPYHVANGPSYLLYYGTIPWTYVIFFTALMAGSVAFLRLRKKRLKMIENESLQLSKNYSTNLSPPEIDIKEDVSAEKHNGKSKTTPIAKDKYNNAEKERGR